MAVLTNDTHNKLDLSSLTVALLYIRTSAIACPDCKKYGVPVCFSALPQLHDGPPGHPRVGLLRHLRIGHPVLRPGSGIGQHLLLSV